MKEIKNYLHLYLGCEVLAEYPKRQLLAKFIGFFNHAYEVVTVVRDGGISDFPIEDIKPILRKLSDMTEEEAKYIFKYYFERDYTDDWTNDTGSIYFNPKRITPTKYHALRIINSEDYQTGDFMKVVELVPYLLSKQFDLFSLINEGLAIDATTLNK